jgi:hypothetical protein
MISTRVLAICVAVTLIGLIADIFILFGAP